MTASAGRADTPLPVFADVDTGVDDALALVYLLASPDAELVGIASTAGNVPVQQVCANNLGLLELCGARGIPVSRGADQPLATPLRTAEDTHGPGGLGYAQLPTTNRTLTEHDSAQAWITAAHRHPGELVGLVTGPMTNLALACRAEPALPTLLRRLVVMGGAFDYPGNTTPVAEWNVFVDPEAAAEVFAACGAAHEPSNRDPSNRDPSNRDPPNRDPSNQGQQHLPIVLGLNVTEKVAMTPTILGRLAAAAGSPTAAMSVLDPRGTRSATPNPVIRVLEDALRFYFEFHFDQGEGYLAHVHDPLAAAVAVGPGLVTTRAGTVDVELAGSLTRGMTVVDWRGHWGREPNARIGVGVYPGVFFDRFIERVGPFARRHADPHS